MNLDVGRDDELFAGQPDAIAGEERQSECLLGVADVEHDLRHGTGQPPHVALLDIELQ